MDKTATSYPVDSDEVSKEPSLPIKKASNFPSDLESLQLSYLSISNYEDLKKVMPGEMDWKTNQPRKQKAVYCTALLGTTYSLDYVLSMTTTSLSSQRVYLKEKRRCTKHQNGLCVGCPPSRLGL